MNKPAVQSYMPVIDLESNSSIKELLADSNNGRKDIDPNTYFQQFALNTSLTLNYGVRIDGSVDNSLLKEIVHVERIVSNLRSTSNNWQDYIPFMRIWPSRNNEAKEYRERRDKYLTLLLDMLKDKIAKGEDKPCITGNVLKDPEAKLNESNWTSMTLSDYRADYSPSRDQVDVPHHGLRRPRHSPRQHHYGHRLPLLASRSRNPKARLRRDHESLPRGRRMGTLPDRRKSPLPYRSRERSASLLDRPPHVPPARQHKGHPLGENIHPGRHNILYGKPPFPPSTTLLGSGAITLLVGNGNELTRPPMQNAWAANYDPTHFKDAASFLPERYLDVAEGTGTPHYGYGAGSRMCAGSHLANRELYTAFIRLISAFEILPPTNGADRPILDALECNASKTSLTLDPKPFKVGFRVRDLERLKGWMEGSEERTKDL